MWSKAAVRASSYGPPLFTCLSLVLLWGGGRTVRDEASELQAVGVPENDPNPAKHFTPLPEDVYKSHRQLEEIARVYTLPLPSQAWLRKLHQTCVNLTHAFSLLCPVSTPRLVRWSLSSSDSEATARVHLSKPSPVTSSHTCNWLWYRLLFHPVRVFYPWSVRRLMVVL